MVSPFLPEVVGVAFVISVIIGAIGGVMGMVYATLLSSDPLTGYEGVWLGILAATVVQIEYSSKYVQIIQLRAQRDEAVRCICEWARGILASQGGVATAKATVIATTLDTVLKRGTPLSTAWLLGAVSGISENGLDLTKYTSATQTILTAQAMHRQLTTAVELYHLRMFLYVTTCFYHAFVQPTSFATVDATFIEMFTAGIARTFLPAMMLVLLRTLVKRCATEM